MTSGSFLYGTDVFVSSSCISLVVGLLVVAVKGLTSLAVYCALSLTGVLVAGTAGVMCVGRGRKMP